MIQQHYNLTAFSGLQAKTAAIFTKTACEFASDVHLYRNKKIANGKSLLSILALGLSKDMSFKMCIEGPDEVIAFSRLNRLLTEMNENAI